MEDEDPPKRDRRRGKDAQGRGTRRRGPRLKKLDKGQSASPPARQYIAVSSSRQEDRVAPARSQSPRARVSLALTTTVRQEREARPELPSLSVLILEALRPANVLEDGAVPRAATEPPLLPAALWRQKAADDAATAAAAAEVKRSEQPAVILDAIFAQRVASLRATDVKLRDWIQRNLPEFDEFWPRAALFSPRSVSYLFSTVGEAGYADVVQPIDWGAVEFCRLSDDEHPLLPAFALMQLRRRVVWLLFRVEAHERIENQLRRLFGSVHGLQDTQNKDIYESEGAWVRPAEELRAQEEKRMAEFQNKCARIVEDIWANEDEWTDPPPNLRDVHDKRVLDERFEQVFHPDPQRSTLSTEFWKTQTKLRFETRETMPLCLWGPLYAAGPATEPFALSAPLESFHRATHRNEQLLARPLALPLPPFHVFVAPVRPNLARGHFGAVRSYYICSATEVHGMTGNGEAHQWLSQWIRFHAGRGPRPATVTSPSFRPSSVNETPWANMLQNAESVVVKTMVLKQHRNNPGIEAPAIVLSSLHCGLACTVGSQFAATHAAVEMFQTKINKDHFLSAMEGMHMDLERFVRNFHPRQKPDSPLAPLGTPLATRRILLWFHLQAAAQLGRGLWNMRHGARLFHGDIKLNNAGVRFRHPLVFRWIDLDCSSLEGGDNRTCTPYNDPFSVQNRSRIDPAVLEPDQRLHTSDDLFFTDVFRFSFMMMLLWTGATVRHPNRQFLREVSNADDRKSEEDDSEQESTDSAHFFQPEAPLTRTIVRGNIASLRLGQRVGSKAYPHPLDKDAVRLLRTLVQLQIHVRSRLQRFEAVLDSLEQFLAREDVRTHFVPSDVSHREMWTQIWRLSLPPTAHLHIYPQWGC